VRICNSSSEWINCYSGNYDLWAEEAYSHPAKMSPAICYRIFQHLKELGLLDKDSVILDSLSGTGTTGLVAASLGYPAILTELEGKFCDLIRLNIDHLESTLGHKVDIQVIQGDARQLSSLLSEKGLVAVTSPPYQYTVIKDGQRLASNPDIHWSEWERGKGYSDNSANIGNLKCVVSPPYENAINSGISGIDFTKVVRENGKPRDMTKEPGFSKRLGGGIPVRYGQTPGQIGKEKAESYQEAMLQVYSECLKVASVLAVVTKDPTRENRLYPLGEITQRLLESSGWHILCRHRAMLFSEVEQGGLFEGSRKKVKGRLSFFKRLSYRKGFPVARWEDVFICVREGEGLKAICSPPYSDMLDSGSRHGDSGIGRRDLAIKRLGTYESKTHGQIGNLK